MVKYPNINGNRMYLAVVNMNQRKHILSAVLGIAALAFTFAGCATSVTFRREMPPALNTLGIQRLAVMPFSTTGNSSLQRQAAALLTNESLLRIQRTNHFSLVNSSDIERRQSSGANLEDYADALFSGQVITASVKDSTRQSSYKDDEGNTVFFTIYDREAQITFNYFITRTRDGTMIGPINKSFNTNDSNDNLLLLKTAEAMIQELVQRGMSGLDHDVAPYTVMERRSLIKETSKDKIIKQRAKDAEAMVKEGNYKIAQEAFLRIYQDTGSYAAGYNVGVLIEVQGNLEEASAFMQRLYNDTGNPKAAFEITRLQRAISDAGLMNAYRANQGQRDRVISLMVDTLPSKMPDNPRVAFINNSQNEKDLAETVINGITDGFLKKRITVIDRNSRALVDMERNYQLSGNVSDDEMVKIGYEAGVNTFVLVTITGSGSSRRLSLRMLDVERNIILYQSPQTDEMNL